MKRITIIAIALAYSVTIFAQNADDAALYSQVFYHGTAKALGMGNAMGAVGGDMTSVCINPAGMGIYRSDEFTTSFNLLDNYSTSNYYGTDNSANKMCLSIPNIGYVHAKQRSNYKALRYTQFGFGLTRTNDFNLRALSKGINPTSSKIDDYLGQIRNEFYPHGYNDELYTSYFPTHQLEEEASAYTILPAWSSYLIDTIRDEIGPYYSSPVPQGNIWQGQECNFKGRSEEWNFSGSANFFDKLFVGISVDLTHIKRTGTQKFMESAVEDTETDFNEWSFEETLESSGWGCNGKIGFIYHATPWFRFGAAFHSPTHYSFDESWQTQTTSVIHHTTYNSFSPDSHYEYYFISPLKCIGSMAFVIGQQGMVSLDMEYTNYGAARFKALANDEYDYGPINDTIKSKYGHTLNFRLGSEWLVGNTYLRMGVGYYGSPFGITHSAGSIKKASCGVSVPLATGISFDFAYELSYGRTFITLYNVADIEPVTQRQFRNNLLATFKLRF